MSNKNLFLKHIHLPISIKALLLPYFLDDPVCLKTINEGMKKFTLPVLVSLISANCFAQQNFHVARGTAIKFADDIQVVMNNTNIINHSDLKQSKGDAAVRFEGDQDNFIGGTGNTAFDRIVIDKEQSEVKLASDINVVSNATFKKGMLDAGDHVIDLHASGTLAGETEKSRAIASGRGFITATAEVTASTVNPGNLGAIINSPIVLGNTVVKRGNVISNNGSDNSANLYFEITPANNRDLNASVAFKYFETELNGIDEKEVSVYSNRGSNWLNEGNEYRDAKQNLVMQKNVNSFSRFTLFPAQENIIVYPNPVRDVANTRIVAKSAATATIEVYDSKGSLVKAYNKGISVGSNVLPLEMKELAGGSYTLHAKWGNNEKVIMLAKE